MSFDLCMKHMPSTTPVNILRARTFESIFLYTINFDYMISLSLFLFSVCLFTSISLVCAMCLMPHATQDDEPRTNNDIRMKRNNVAETTVGPDATAIIHYVNVLCFMQMVNIYFWESTFFFFTTFGLDISLSISGRC